MKSVSGNPALDAYQRVAGVAPARPVTQGQPAASEAQNIGDAARVDISEAARELASAGQVVDARKVEALKQKIDDGSYQVDSAVVARRMLDILG